MKHLVQSPIDSLANTSSITVKRLKSLGIKTYWDLLNYFPFRYEDYSIISQINQLQEGEVVTIRGKVAKAKNSYIRAGLTLQKVTLADETGSLELIWYNQPYLVQLLSKSNQLTVAGVVKKNLNKLTVEPKEYQLLQLPNQETIHTGRVVPIYPEKRGLSSRTLREKIYYIFRFVGISQLEYLPGEIISFNSLMDENEAYLNIHFPKSKQLEDMARERLSFDELFTIQLSAQLIKKEWVKEKVGNQFEIKKHLQQLTEFINNLPFRLTNSQQKVVKDILQDLSQKQPMNRFLQGEVGSGKTVLAAIACYLAYLNGYQSLFMAPTEILAQQHFVTVSKLLSPLNVEVELITGGKKPSSTTNSKQLATNAVIGTHALLNQKLDFKKVGLVIVDEQHRFGVKQRAVLKTKGINPHLLSMTATPIPRTMALALYGELDISTIDQLPPGRIPIKSYLVPRKKRGAMYKWLEERVQQEDQAFIICPLIEQSEAETMQSVRAAVKEYDYLAQEIFPRLKLGLLHGRMKSKAKDQIMNDFKNKKYEILVSTSVVEVGIDIPNATIMVIEGAERYGLAQLHQLRGRVGRGNKQSYCLVFTEAENSRILKRLSYFVKNLNGVQLAEYDLQTRGPGEIYGTMQHGFSDLKIASLADYPLLSKTKRSVEYFMEKYPDLNKFPTLQQRLTEYEINQIARD